MTELIVHTLTYTNDFSSVEHATNKYIELAEPQTGKVISIYTKRGDATIENLNKRAEAGGKTTSLSLLDECGSAGSAGSRPEIQEDGHIVAPSGGW